MTRPAPPRAGVDEPTELPDDTVLELTVADAGDELDGEERAELHAALEEGLVDMHIVGPAPRPPARHLAVAGRS